MDDQQITVGEVYRLIERQVLPAISDIKKDVKAQNGRVRALEKDAVRMKTIWFGLVVLLGLGIDWAKHKLGIS